MEKVIIASSYFSSEELSGMLELDNNIAAEVLSDEEEVRSDAVPILLLVYAIKEGISIAERIVKLLRNRHKSSQPKIEITVKCPGAFVKLLLDISDEEFDQKMTQIRELCFGPKIFIKKKEDV